MAWVVWVFVGFSLVWDFFIEFFELKGGRTNVCQTASHRACFIQGGTNFIAFEDFWAEKCCWVDNPGESCLSFVPEPWLNHVFEKSVGI